jgi:hypothetical protein
MQYWSKKRHVDQRNTIRNPGPGKSAAVYALISSVVSRSFSVAECSLQQLVLEKVGKMQIEIVKALRFSSLTIHKSILKMKEKTARAPQPQHC